MQKSFSLSQRIRKKKSLYRIKYILRLSCVKSLVRKHKSTVRTFLKRLGSELLEEFLTEEEHVLSLIFPRASSTSRRFDLYRGRIWYLDIICINDLVNYEWLVTRPCNLERIQSITKKNSFISIKCSYNKNKKIKVDQLSIQLF